MTADRALRAYAAAFRAAGANYDRARAAAASAERKERSACELLALEAYAHELRRAQARLDRTIRRLGFTT